jgi:glycosyltransferase involved in cell wall biosynthesis
MPGEPPNPTLSLCIPTFNRAAVLDNLLASVASQTFPLSYELRVQDNASADDTARVFERHAAGRGNWFYERNERNFGGRVNIGICARSARGRYVQIVGDDDHFADDGFENLDRLIRVADATDAAAIFGCHRLGPDLDGVPLEGGFEWLRWVSINVPAFISAVVWRRSVWESYPYFDYPKEMSLPQLDCFVETCLRRTVVVTNRDLVVRGDCEPTDRATFWFYARNPLLDAFEYPVLYRKVLRDGRMDPVTRFWIEARRLRMVQLGLRATLFIAHNRDYYHPTVDAYRRAHGGTYYWPFLWLAVGTILHTAPGRWLSALYCERIKRLDKLPPKDATPHDF